MITLADRDAIYARTTLLAPLTRTEAHVLQSKLHHAWERSAGPLAWEMSALLLDAARQMHEAGR